MLFPSVFHLSQMSWETLPVIILNSKEWKWQSDHLYSGDLWTRSENISFGGSDGTVAERKSLVNYLPMKASCRIEVHCKLNPKIPLDQKISYLQIFEDVKIDNFTTSYKVRNVRRCRRGWNDMLIVTQRWWAPWGQHLG